MCNKLTKPVRSEDESSPWERRRQPADQLPHKSRSLVNQPPLASKTRAGHRHCASSLQFTSAISKTERAIWLQSAQLGRSKRAATSNNHAVVTLFWFSNAGENWISYAICRRWAWISIGGRAHQCSSVYRASQCVWILVDASTRGVASLRL